MRNQRGFEVIIHFGPGIFIHNALVGLHPFGAPDSDVFRSRTTPHRPCPVWRNLVLLRGARLPAADFTASDFSAPRVCPPALRQGNSGSEIRRKCLTARRADEIGNVPHYLWPTKTPQNPVRQPLLHPHRKRETVRITLPPKPEDTPMVKHETVRINAPGAAPKKETTTIAGATPLAGSIPSVPPPPPATATPPLVPPPTSVPRPPSAPGMPAAGTRPGMPPVAPKPVVPPSAPAMAPKASTYAEAKPVTMKAAPKKETARIQIAPTQKLPPQATVRLSSQPSQALYRRSRARDSHRSGPGGHH